MSYVRNCENDLFISYAHYDNDPLFKGERGWVEVFHQALEVRLRQLLGEQPQIWRDPALAGNDYLDDTLRNRLLRTALLLSIVTPRYLRSQSCLTEVDEFCRAAERTGGIRFDDKARLLKVVKTEVPRDDLPAPLKPLLGYAFYAVDEANRPREYRLPPTAGDQSYKACLDTLEDLAYDIKTALEALQRIALQGEAAPAAARERIVYVAETISDLRPHADQLKRELRQRGFVVYPCEAFPADAAGYREASATQLRSATLSIHLLGELYGTALEGDSHSTVEMQIDEAGAIARTGALRRVIWLPENLAPKEDRQREFLESVQKTEADQPNTEVLQISIENLKTYVLRKLTEDAKPAPAAPVDAAPLMVYLINDQPDAAAVGPLRDRLMALGYEVKPSYFEGSEKELREYHQESLVQCDAALIYYGTPNALWVQRKLYDLRKAMGLGRQRPFLAKAVIVGTPSTPDKGSFRTREAIVVDALQGFSDAAFAPFLRELAPQ
jgi:uncharacterized protein DUF4062